MDIAQTRWCFPSPASALPHSFELGRRDRGWVGVRADHVRFEEGRFKIGVGGSRGAWPHVFSTVAVDSHYTVQSHYSHSAPTPSTSPGSAHVGIRCRSLALLSAGPL
eukprot:2110967-Rhodomonas_salina.2